MTREEIVNRWGRPASAGFPRSTVQLLNRRTMALVFQSDSAAIRAVLPEPLTPLPAERVIHCWSRLPGSAGAPDSYQTRLVIPCRLGGMPCHYLALDRLSETAPSGSQDDCPAAERQLRARLAPRPPVRLEASLSRVQCVLNRVADVDGGPALAQLIGMCPLDVSVKNWWAAGGQLPGQVRLDPDIDASVDAGRLGLPLRQLVGAHYYIADMTLQAGRVLVDYLRPDRRLHANAA